MRLLWLRFLMSGAAPGFSRCTAGPSYTDMSARSLVDASAAMRGALAFAHSASGLFGWLVCLRRAVRLAHCSIHATEEDAADDPAPRLWSICPSSVRRRSLLQRAEPRSINLLLLRCPAPAPGWARRGTALLWRRLALVVVLVRD